MISPGDHVVLIGGHDCTGRGFGKQVYRVDDVGVAGNGEWHCIVCQEWNIPAGREWALINGERVPILWLRKVEETAALEAAGE